MAILTLLSIFTHLTITITAASKLTAVPDLPTLAPVPPTLTPTPTLTLPTSTPTYCTSPIPCPPSLCPPGQCYVYTTRTSVGAPCPTLTVCGCGPNPYVSTPVVNPTPRPVEACREEEVHAIGGCGEGQTAVPTSFGAGCRQCVCVDE